MRDATETYIAQLRPSDGSRTHDCEVRPVEITVSEKDAKAIRAFLLLHPNSTNAALLARAEKAERERDALRDALLDRLREIDADERFHYPCANVLVNAPLALEQIVMETDARTAQRLLALIGYKGPEMKIKRGPVQKSRAVREGEAGK